MSGPPPLPAHGDPFAEIANEYMAVKHASQELLRQQPKPRMHIYLDDSGDGSVHPQASSHLIMSMCVFRSTSDIEHARAVIDACAARWGVKGEFKFSKLNKRVKEHFFEAMEEVQFSVRAIVMDKALIRSGRYRSSPSRMKALAISQLLSHGFGQISQAKVFIDGEDTKAFEIEDSAHFLEAANAVAPYAVQEVKFADSASNRMIQIADMHAGAINAAVRRNKHQLPQYFESFRSRTWQPGGTLWHFR